MKGLSSYEVRQLILSVGTHKSTRPLSPVEVAKLMQKALEAGEAKREVAAKLLLKDSSIIRRFIRLLSLPSEVQQLVGWGSNPTTVSFTAGSEIARLGTDQDRLALATAALQNRFNKSEIMQVVQIRMRAGKPIEECVKAVLNQRPVIERRHVIIGNLQSERLKDELKQFSQLERDNLLQSALDRCGPNVPRLGSKLGHGHFLLVGDDLFHAAIVSLPKGFEQAITEYLLRELDSED